MGCNNCLHPTCDLRCRRPPLDELAFDLLLSLCYAPPTRHDTAVWRLRTLLHEFVALMCVRMLVMVVVVALE